MSSVIKKIFDGVSDEGIHRAFVKFSKGTFPDRYVVEAKQTAKGWTIKTSAEFANFLVAACLPSEGMVQTKGVIVSTFDLREEMGGCVFDPEEKVKQFMGIKQLMVDGEVEVSRVRALLERFPRAFFALSFSSEKGVLKIKPKAPKSAKPSTKGEKEVKADFCSVKTSSEEIVQDLLFDYPEAKEVKILHEIVVEDIELPKGVTDSVEIREKAIRKGVLRRKVVADGFVQETEKGFAA